MKKLLAVLLTVLLAFAMTACNKEVNNNDSSVSESSQATNTSSVASDENESDNVKESSTLGSGNTNSNKTQNNSSQKNDKTSSNSTEININRNPSNQNNASQSNEQEAPNDNENYENVDNGVLEKATSQDMELPENMKLLGTNEAKEENNSENIQARVVLYELDGDVVNWTTENDLIYAITKGNNRLVVINSKNMEPLFNTPLAGKPAEISLVDDKIYISMPDLCRIDIFSKSDGKKISSLNFEHEVSSFCIDGDYVYYSEHDQHCKVFRKNLTTNEVVGVFQNGYNSFYYPKLYLNKEDNILYIGESETTGSKLYYYDATTLEHKGTFIKGSNGMINHTREMFHIDDEIFWANYRLSDTDPKQIIGRYGEGDYGSVNFASKELVATFEGIFITDTYECVVNYFDARFNFEYLLVTESKNIFFRARSIDTDIIIGVNFKIQ